MNTFLLQHFGGADAFPRGGDLDEYVIAAYLGLVVLRDNAAGLRDGGFGVVGKASVDFSGDAARNDGEDFFAECDGEVLESEVGDVLVARTVAQFLS